MDSLFEHGIVRNLIFSYEVDLKLPSNTPCLLLDHEILDRNCRRMGSRLMKLGLRLRPHMKTAKSVEVAKLASRDHFGGITVSTLAEADFFFEAGIKDIAYAVAMVPGKIHQAARLSRAGCRLSLLTDDLTTIYKIAKQSERLGVHFPVSIEINSGGNRGGLLPMDPQLLKIAATIIHSPALRFEGLLTHGGHAYHSASISEIRQAAEDERKSVVTASRRLEDRGILCPVTSTGSTPTATYIQNVTGITEMRPGVYMFGDLAQVDLQCCVTADIAATVATTVIGHNKTTGELLIDAGALALSQDLSPQSAQNTYGRLSGDENLRVVKLNQEHGFVSHRTNSMEFEKYPIGSVIRILPNHICMTAAAYNRMYVIENSAIDSTWKRATGW